MGISLALPQSPELACDLPYGGATEQTGASVSWGSSEIPRNDFILVGAQRCTAFHVPAGTLPLKRSPFGSQGCLLSILSQGGGWPRFLGPLMIKDNDAYANGVTVSDKHPCGTLHNGRVVVHDQGRWEGWFQVRVLGMDEHDGETGTSGTVADRDLKQSMHNMAFFFSCGFGSYQSGDALHGPRI
jgi:hypothetical protein